MKKSLKESEVLRVELEEVKRRLKEFEASLQLKDEEISRLFDEAKGHFAVGVNSPSWLSNPNYKTSTLAR